MAAPYAYPTPNSTLIAAHALQAHFEGGFFAQTVALASASGASGASTPALTSSASSAEPSREASPALSVSTLTPENRELSASGPAAFLECSNGKAAQPEAPMFTDATQIYYLLTPASWRGRMHMNLHAVSHDPPSTH
jgi:hypothetical protein